MAAEALDLPDLHTTEGKLAQLRHKVDEAGHAGSAKAVDAQHARGKQTARERIDSLLDEGSFVETDAPGAAPLDGVRHR